MTPELGLAIDAAINENTALIVGLYKKAKDCWKFRDKCTALCDDAAILSKIVEKNKFAIDSFETLAALQDCLKDADTFVTSVKIGAV